MVKIKKSKDAVTYGQLETFDDFLEALSEEKRGEDEEGQDTDAESTEDEGQKEEEDDVAEDPEDRATDEEQEKGAGSDEETSLKGHKKALQSLAQTDPEFFSYLRENDSELLNFDYDDDEDSSGDEDEEDPVIHTPAESLEVASDSEAEEELLDDQSNEHKQKVATYLKKGIVNLHVIADWEKRLSTTKDLPVLTNVVDAFECAVQSILKEETVAGMKWRVEGSSNFNALMRICVRHVKGFCVRFLCGSNNAALSEKRFDENPQEIMEKSKGKWIRLRPKIKSYMKALVVFLKSMGNPEAIAAVLRHCQKMSGFWALMTTKSFKLLKAFINIWSTGEDSCRVAAFLSIIRMANYNKDVYLTRVFKQMYMGYVANCKFTSVNTWPAINFMRSSLVEIYLLDTSVCYSVAFPFIRQLAIHLRNAATAGTAEQTKQGKKEASRIVYSWQFVHSVHIWADLLAQAVGGGDESLRLLVYPVVQICLGTIKLIPTRKYIPLRFHIVRMLITLQDKTKIFIPILPLVTEVLNLTDFSSKTVGKFSVRPLDIHCCLKADPAESGYFKAVSEAVFDSILGVCKAVATELSFPEILTPALMQIRTFIKKNCKNADVSRKYKNLIEKIEAHSNFVKAKRTKAMDDGLVSLADPKSHQILRLQIETAKPEAPILAYAREYFRLNAKVTAKAKKNQTETKEERRIPKPKGGSSAVANTGSGPLSREDVFGMPLFSQEDPDDDLPGSDDDESDGKPFKTKFDEEPSPTPPNLDKPKKRKQKQAAEDSGKKKLKLKKVKKPKNTVADVDDELVDLEFSD